MRFGGGEIGGKLEAALNACRRHFTFALFFSALLNLLFIAPMLYMLQVYDRVVPTAGQTTLILLTLVLLFALMTLSALDAIRSRLLVRASVRLDKILAPLILEATLARPDQGSQGVVKQSLREFDTLRQALTGAAILAVLDAPWLPIYIAIAFLIHTWIGVLAVAGALLMVFLAWRTEQATREPLEEATAAAGRAYADLEFTAAASDSVRALGLRRAMVSGQLAARDAMMELQTGASFAASRLTATTKFVRLTLQSAALGLGAYLAIKTEISPGALFASMFIVGRALAPIDQMVGSWRTILQARGAYHNLKELLDEQPADIALTELPPPTGSLSVENLTVLDPTRRPILSGVSFAMKPGEVVAIVGPSGAGKSTLVRALSGAVLPAGGTIRFDGADQRNWDSERLADYIGYMPQEPALFAGTIKDNIARFRSRLGEDQAAIDADAVAAAQQAGAHDFILHLPRGYDYALGLGGRGLSVGQAQRVALARALFRGPRYLILDEPNANLDSEGDAHLTKMLEAAKAMGLTIIVVAHRMSVLPVIDRILVMREGRLILDGPRDDVLQKIGIGAPRARVASEAKAG